MKFIFLFVLLSSSGISFAQRFRSGIHFSVIYDNLQVNKIPSYVEVNGLNFPLHTEGIYNTSTPTWSLELGYALEKKLQRSIKWYTGLSLCYRRINLDYIDKNLYYLKLFNGETTEIFFEANVKRDFVIVQIPIGITIPMVKKLNFDLGIRNNLLIKVFSHQTVNDRSFSNDLVALEQRSPRKFMLEVSGGFNYAWPSYAVGLKYIQGITPLYADTKNAYNQLIPSKLYFSSILLSIDIKLGKLIHDDK